MTGKILHPHAQFLHRPVLENLRLCKHFALKSAILGLQGEKFTSNARKEQLSRKQLYLRFARLPAVLT